MSNSSNTNTSRLDPLVVAGDAEDVASGIIIPSVSEASAIPRPTEVDQLWVDDEYDELEREQEPLWDASGEEASRDPGTIAAREELSATTAEELLASHLRHVDDSSQRYLDTLSALARFRRRAHGSKPWYQFGKVGLFLGDVSGVAAAAILLGDEILLALLLALSAATATIAAGLIGTEVRDSRTRRARASAYGDDLPDDLVPFAHLFSEADSGEHRLWPVVKVSFATAAMIGLGIGTLRAVVDDPLVGIVFGGFALAVAGGSFLVSYAGADQVADLIDHAQADYKKADAEHRRMAADTSWKDHAAAKVNEASIRAEHAHRARAAQDHVRALKFRVLRINPHVAGHGRGAPAVGRTLRREEAPR